MTLLAGTEGGSKGGLRSGRNELVLHRLDRKLIGARQGVLLEPPELGLEGREVLDRAVDRREHDGGYAVQPRESAKCELAHPFGWDLAAMAPDFLLDRGDDLVELFLLDGPFGRRSLEPTEELVAVERLALSIALDHVHTNRLGPLVGREALVARFALPAPADGVSGLAGIHDAVLARSAVRTLHAPPILQPLVVVLPKNHKILWKFRNLKTVPGTCYLSSRLPSSPAVAAARTGDPAITGRIVTGERAVTGAAGFNPSWQRHVFAYACAGQFLGPGRVLDLGCGTGHSFELLAPRESVGVDVDARSLADQARPTVVADMRSLPFGDATFDSVACMHAIEHVPDAAAVLAEAVRVLRDDGVAIFVTPNRLTFGKPDEIIDPYHYVEYDPDELGTLLAPFFERVEIYGVFGSPRHMALVDGERQRLDKLLAIDPLRLRRLVPRRARQVLYDLMLTRARRHATPEVLAIDQSDFSLRRDQLDEALDLYAVASGPRRMR